MIQKIILIFLMSSQLIFLDTRYSNGSLNYNTVFQLSLNQLQYLDKFKISLQKVEFPNAVYPINRFNNVFVFSEDSGVTLITVTITANDYTGTTLAAELQAAMIAAGAHAYVVAYDSTTMKMTITDGTGTFMVIPASLAIYENLGLDENLFDIDTASFVGSYPVNISGTRYVDLITNFSGNNYSVGASVHVLARIPVMVPFGNIVFFSQTTDDFLTTSHRELDELQVQLRDDRGNFFELPDNAHLSIVLKLTFD